MKKIASMITDKYIALFALLLACFFGSMAPIFGKFALQSFKPLTIVFFRFVLASAILIILLYKSKKYSVDKKDRINLISVSLLFTGTVFFFILGLKNTTAIMSQLMYLFNPIIVLLLSIFILKKKFSIVQIIGIIFGIFGGSFIILRSFLNKSQDLLFSIGSFKGNVTTICSVLCWGCYIFFSKKLSKKYSSLLLTTYAGIITCIVSIPFFIQEILSNSIMFHQIKIMGIIGIICLSLFNSIAMLFLYQWGIKRTDAFTASTVSFLSPLFTGLWAIPLFSEKIDSTLLISATLIFISVIFTTIFPLLSTKLKKNS